MLNVSRTVLIISIIVVLGTSNSIGENQLKREFEAIKLGVKVKVNGLNMNVNIIGEKNDLTLVLIPGLGVVAPAISYKAFAESLADKYKIIIIERFGYGLSDITKEERINENLVSELHTCLQQLGVKKYYLMAHSIGGIYCLAYANKYPEEVLGFIGLDNTPKSQDERKLGSLEAFVNNLGRLSYKLGLFRFMPEKFISNFIYLDNTYQYSSEDLINLNIIFRYTSFNDNISNEKDNLVKNINDVISLNFPDNMPVIMFLASENCKSVPDWEDSHRDMLNNHPDSEIIILEGTHYIYKDQRKAISDKLKTWIK